MKIIGLRIEKYIGEKWYGHNCDFTQQPEEFERHILLAELSDKRKIEITLSYEEGECGSGWCLASWGNIEIKEIGRFGGYQYKPKKELIIDDILPNNVQLQHEYDNEVFTISYDGDDSYYPSGGYEVDMSLFKETIRAKEKRPVWLFMGDSNLGKSFLSDKMIGMTKYETDSNKELPNVITETIIVLGRRYKFTIDDIKSRILGEYELILVAFTTTKETNIEGSIL